MGFFVARDLVVVSRLMEWNVRRKCLGKEWLPGVVMVVARWGLEHEVQVRCLGE